MEAVCGQCVCGGGVWSVCGGGVWELVCVLECVCGGRGNIYNGGYCVYM